LCLINEEKTAEAEQVAPLKIKLKNATVQRDESQDKELEDAIEKISNSNKDGSDTLKTYKKNSTFLRSAVPANAKTKLGENRTKWKEDRLLISTEKILL
jgi:hypothetical protein